MLPGQEHRGTDAGLVGGFETDRSTSLPAPGAACRREHLGMEPDELVLLLGSELHHAPLLAGPERRENSAVRAEVGMAHVRLLAGVLQAERDLTEIVGRHGEQERTPGRQRSQQELYDLIPSISPHVPFPGSVSVSTPDLIDRL